VTRVWGVLEFTFAVHMQAVLATLPRKMCFASTLKILVNKCSRTQLIRIANYPDWLGRSDKHFLTVIVLHLFMP